MKNIAKTSLKYVYIILFFLISLAPVCLFVIFGQGDSEAAVGNIEKKESKLFPSIYTQDGINVSFDDQCEEWLNQNIPFRANVLTGINMAMSNVFREPTSNVVTGREGWIFSTETIDDYIGNTSMSEEDIRNMGITLSLIQENVENGGGRFLFMPVPNKNSIYPEYMPVRYQNAPENNMSRVLRELGRTGVNTVDLKSALLRAKENAEIPRLYYKRDTHWTVFGALIGYEGIMEGLGSEQDQRGMNNDGAKKGRLCDGYVPDYTTEHNRKSDLDKLLYPAGNSLDEEYVLKDSIDCNSFEFITPDGVADTKAQLENFMSDKEDHDNNFTTRKIAPMGDQKLYMFRDSFARALLPFVIDSYDEATFVRTTTPSIEGVPAGSDVIYEICERNLKNVIGSAPFMYAPERSETVDIYKVYNSELNSCIYSDEGYAYRVYGTVDPRMIGEDGRIYLRAYDGDSHTRLFEAFPILEEELLSDACDFAPREKSQLRGYSLYIPKGIFSQEEIDLRIVSGGNESDICATLSPDESQETEGESVDAAANPYGTENADHQLVYRGCTISIGDNMNTLKSQLGDMAAPSEIVNSCLSGTDAFLYYYPGITIETDMEGNIYYVSLMDNSYSDGQQAAETSRGIAIGSDKMDIWEKLGDPIRENDKNCTYETEHLKITYSYKAGKITSVILEDRKYSADDAAEAESQADNGMTYESGNAYLYDDENLIQTGWQIIDGEYFFFDRLTGERITGQTVDGIEIGPDGELNLTEYDKKKIETMMKAHDIVMQVTVPTDTMEEKRRKVFDWVLSFPYHRFRHIRDVYKEEGIEITEANDIFDEGAGDCVSESAAVAFLFHEIGYENVYWVHDTGHSWVRSDDRLFDPLFAESRGFDANYDAPFTDYRNSMEHSMLIY